MRRSFTPTEYRPRGHLETNPFLGERSQVRFLVGARQKSRGIRDRAKTAGEPGEPLSLAETIASTSPRRSSASSPCFSSIVRRPSLSPRLAEELDFSKLDG
jgi:hypothetical protein